MSSSPVRRNVAANFGGSLWTGLMSILFIPVYVRFMGVEAYGLVGVFATLQSLFALLDLGLSTTLNREFARLSAMQGEEMTRRKLLRTFEIIYWAIALICGVTVVSLAHLIARQWVQPEHLSVETIDRAIKLMAIVIVFQWPFALYSGGLLGQQRQVALNVINVVMATLRGVGAIVVLWAFSPTVMAFFVWQAVISLLTTSATAVQVWRGVGGTKDASFDAVLLRAIWRFAAGMLGIALLSTAIAQIDKVVVSKVLPLRMFGYYAIAGTVAAGLYRLVTPVFSALFPRFSQLAALGQEHELSLLYHRSCRLMSVIMLPAALFTAFFSPEILLLWTRDPGTVSATHVVLSMLVIGTAMSGLASLPYAMQLAYGWTRLTLTFNVIAAVLLAPGIYWLTSQYGVVGASVGWLTYNVSAAVVVPALMHRRILRGEQARFYLRDVGVPLLVAAAVCALARPLINGAATPLLVMELLSVALIVQVATALTMPEVRGWLRGRPRLPLEIGL